MTEAQIAAATEALAALGYSIDGMDPRELAIIALSAAEAAKEEHE